MGFSCVVSWVAAGIAILFSAATLGQETPEAVYRKFHEATIAHNFKELRKWGTAEIGNQLAAAPAAQRDSMIALIGGMMPKSYTVTGNEISPDGAKAILRLSGSVEDQGKAGTVLGTITLVKEGGAWKVLAPNWGGDQIPGPSMQTGSVDKGQTQPARSVPQPGKSSAERHREREAAQQVAAEKRAQEAKRRQEEINRQCVFKPVMSDEEIAACRAAFR